MEIYPVINAADEEEAIGLLARARKLVSRGEWLHIDVADGCFTPHRTFDRVDFWERVAKVYQLEVHLMVEDPVAATEVWLRAGARRVIVHWEALSGRVSTSSAVQRKTAIDDILHSCRRHQAEVLLATNPETHLSRLQHHLARFSGYQVLAVHPGLSSQNFQWRAIEKIKFLRRHFPDATIEVDGGITPEVVRRVKEAGATRAVSATYLWKQVHPEKALAELRAL